MNKNTFAIIEIGSNNTKTHIYENENLIYENNTTIEFKKNYKSENKLNETDISKLYEVIKKALRYTNEIHIYGCSIFRNIEKEELEKININLKETFNVVIEVVSQEDEALYTALGCYSNIDYSENMCVFIGGGGSIELLFIHKRKIVDKKYYNFGVVDVTNQFPSLKDDVPQCSFDEVYQYISDLIGNLDRKADILILAGGDHIYWYQNAKYQLLDNTIYQHENQKYMLTSNMSDKYDRNALITSLDKIREIVIIQSGLMEQGL